MTDLEMLRTVCEKTNALDVIDRQDYHLARRIRERLEATKPAPKPFAPSGVEPESTASIVNRLPTPLNRPQIRIGGLGKTWKDRN